MYTVEMYMLFYNARSVMLIEGAFCHFASNLVAVIRKTNAEGNCIKRPDVFMKTCENWQTDK